MTSDDRTDGDTHPPNSGPVEGPGTWHYGLIARWWADTNEADPSEVVYYADAIRRHGQPALDVGCGTGRLLLPLLALGLDIDGTDISGDMLAFAAARAEAQGHSPRLIESATHELDLERAYRTIFLCGVFGIGASREQDKEALRRLHSYLQPGGALLIEHWLPYADRSEESWARWLPGHRSDVPREFPTRGERRRLRDGDELELMSRVVAFEPLSQRHVLEMKARLLRGDVVILEETSRLSENLYFAQELVGMLHDAGFEDVVLEGAHTGVRATEDDATVVLVARRHQAGMLTGATRSRTVPASAH
jgi:SAM-dependent methyltransferase